MSNDLPPLLPQTGEARLRAIIEEMHRHVVGALSAVHSSESPTIPVRLVGKWVTEFDDVLSAGSAQAQETPPRMFSIQDGPDIPWSVIAPFDKQCQRNHGGQTLERLHQRGGLGVSEALAVLHAEDYDKRYPWNKPHPSKETLILELVALVKERLAASSSDEQAEKRP